MKLIQHAVLVALLTQPLAGCLDDNDSEVNELQEQVAALQDALTDAESDSETIAALEAEIAELTTQLESLESASDTEVAELEAALTSLEEQLAALTAEAPKLGVTTGANVLPMNSNAVWRFAVFPDTQGRDDDNMKVYVNVDRDGNTLDVSEWIGVDYNGDGYYDAGTESQNDAVKEGDWDEDGISYLVNVSDPFHPFIETDDDGNPIVVAPEDRKDFGPDWKILPLPLVEAVTDKIIELDTDLVLATGDITEYRAESDYVMWMEKIAAPLTEANVSIFPVRGNHEIVNGRNWPAWFTNEQEWERQSVNNVYNDINPYDGYDQVDFDQGYRLYAAYSGSLVADHLAAGTVTGFPGSEDLVYYFIHDNTLFIALDFYFSDINSSTFSGTWTLLRSWLTEVITENAESVDHIVAFGHEPLSTKKRPQTYQVEEYEAYVAELNVLEQAVEDAQTAYDSAIENSESAETIAVLETALSTANDALEEIEEPSLAGLDIGQLGYLLEQDAADPGLADEILSLFTEYQVNYICGHDHQYARSLIHSEADHVDSASGFTQLIGGSASWKSYEDEYGIEDDYETGLYIHNFKDAEGGDTLTNSEGLDYASVTDDLSNGISFVLVEINGRQITTKSYFANHNLTEVDMNLGAHYDYDSNSWCTYSGDYMVDGVETVKTCTPVEWQIVDENTRTIDSTKRVVAPEQSYYAYSITPDDEGYVGSEAAIVDGYNLTYNSSWADSIGRTELMRELVTLSWFVDEDAITHSDVLWVSGNQTQEGQHFDHYGYQGEITQDVDEGVLAEGESESLTYINQNGYEVNNPTHVTRDGVMNKGTDLEASLNPDLEDGNPSSSDSNWDGRYLDDGLDFADAMTLMFQAPDGQEITELTIGRYDEESEEWVQAYPEECYVETGYSQHFSVHYRIKDQHPESGYGVDNCQQRYWGYIKDSNTIWGFIHTDGKFAVIDRIDAQ